jgi:hypothetical protein
VLSQFSIREIEMKKERLFRDSGIEHAIKRFRPILFALGASLFLRLSECGA